MRRQPRKIEGLRRPTGNDFDGLYQRYARMCIDEAIEPLPPTELLEVFELLALQTTREKKLPALLDGRKPQDPRMADSLANEGRRDRARINIEQDHEVRYWSNKVGVSEDQLREAVEAVGPMVDAVERQLEEDERQIDGPCIFR